MNQIKWKSDSNQSKFSAHINFTNEDQDDNSENKEEMVFDKELFLGTLRSLINDPTQYDLLFEIEEQIYPFPITQIICVLNSQLAQLVFKKIEDFTPEHPEKFIISCLNLCSFFLSIHLTEDDLPINPNLKNNIKFIKERYKAFITPKFINSLKEMLKSSNYLNHSLLVISNSFYQTDEAFKSFNIIELLDSFLVEGDEKVFSICSLIFKRLLKCNFEYDPNQNFPIQFLDKIIEYSTVFIKSEYIFAQMKTLQMLSKLVRQYSSAIDYPNNSSFCQFIIDSINFLNDTTDVIILGNVLHLILSIIEVVNQYNDYLSSFFSEIPICDITKNGLSSEFVFIQSASSEILSFLISFPSEATYQLLQDSEMVEFSIETMNNSDFKGKDKIKKAVFGLFWRDDISIEDLIDKQGIQFLIENLSIWPDKVVPILNLLMIKYPNIVDDLLDLDVINELDEIILNDHDFNDNIHIMAQALKTDILKLADIEE